MTRLEEFGHDLLNALREDVERREVLREQLGHGQPPPALESHVEKAAEAAWREAQRLVTTYARIVVRLPSHAVVAAEDIAQDVLIRLQDLHVLDLIRRSGEPTGYLITMLKNTANDRLRLHQREEAAFGRLAQEILLCEHEDEDHSTEHNELRRALRRLPPDDRRLLRERFGGKKGKRIADLAMAQGTTYAAMAQRLFRILRRLRRDLQNSP